ncbi:MAG TPA: GFA family protein [Candidatus Binataceae bacterium]|nr:GFA family protein [Candidatus Binataceae bacterium]
MSESSGSAKTYRGGCHCGRVAFEVTGRIDAVEECNCSICSRKGYLHWIVAPDAFRLLTPRENLATYTFNTRVAQHHFCPVCGVASFYIPRSDPGKIDVNVRCLDGVDIARLKIIPFDGRNWEKSFHETRAGRRDG